MSDLRIATRPSRLAMAQAHEVAAALARAHPGLEVGIVEVKSTGDTDRSTPVTELTEVGAFVRGVQHAVLDGRADLAVHSCKDLPTDGPPELSAHYPRREAPWDVLVGSTLGSLPAGARVGTGSPRRQAQLVLLRRDLKPDEIRGNIDTRLAKVEGGEFDALVLAEAGLRRIGRDSVIEHRFDLQEMVPAPGQGALAVEATRGSRAEELLAAIDHPPTRRAVEAERAVLVRTSAGCRSALGVYARDDDGGIAMSGFVADERGSRTATIRADSPATGAALLQEALEL